MNTTLLAVLLSLFFTVMITVISFLIYQYYQKNKKIEYVDQISYLIGEDDEQDKNPKTKRTLVQRWNNYWNKLFQSAGVAKYNNEASNAGKDVLMMLIGSIVLVSIITQNIILGIIITGGIVFGLITVLRMRFNKKIEELNDQLPPFLFALKSNLQASETNERAMEKVIESMPSPLYDDLIIVRNKLRASSTFKEAMEELQQKTLSDDLKFLSACMIQATSTGSSLEAQLDSIQKVLEERKKVSDGIKQAIKQASPVMWLTSFTLPALFLYSYLFDSQAKQFWFKEPLSYIVLLVVIVLYVAGMWLVRKQVNNIRDT